MDEANQDSGTRYCLGACVVAALACISLLGFYAYMRVLHPTVAFMDSMRFLVYFAASEEGRASIFSTWGQGEHHGFFPQMAVYLNAKYLGYRVYLFTLLNGVVIVATASLLAWEQIRTLKPDDFASWVQFSVLACVTFFGMISLSNWEIYSLDVGVTLFAKNQIFIAYWIGISREFQSSSKLRFAVLAVSPPVIVLVFAFGWCYAFVIASVACIFFIYGKGRRQVVLAASLLASLAAYGIGGYIVRGAVFEYRSGETGSLTNFLIGIIYAIPSGFVGTETLSMRGTSEPARAIFTLVVIAVSIFLLMRVRRLPRIPYVPVVLLAYGFLQALAVSYARGRFDPTIAAASRYFVDLSLIPIGLTWLAVLDLRQSPGPRKWSVPESAVFFGIVVCFAASQFVSDLDEWRKAPSRHAVFLKMREIVLRGKATPKEASVMRQPVDVANRAIEIQRRYRLGPYRDPN